MTDEEKAEENYIKYRDANCKITRNDFSGHLHKDWRESGIDRHKAFTDGFIYGLDEGRKEFDSEVTKLLNSYGIQFIDCNSIGGLIAFHQLYLEVEKENKISEEIIIGEQQEINRLEKELAESKAEIKQIIEREKVVPEHYLCEMIEKNKELKSDLEEARMHCKAVDEVNEKMKCCENCINYKTGNCTEDNMFYARTTKQCDKWELAEKE